MSCADTTLFLLSVDDASARLKPSYKTLVLVRHQAESQSMAATLNLLKILSISEFWSLPMDAAADLKRRIGLAPVGLSSSNLEGSASHAHH